MKWRGNLQRKVKFAQGTQIFILHTVALTQETAKLNKGSQLSSEDTRNGRDWDEARQILLDGNVLGEAGSRHGFVPLKSTVKSKSKGA